MKIYFAGSIRGGREKAEDYKKIISILSLYGTVLTEHLGNMALSGNGLVVGEEHMTDEEIFTKDVDFLDESDLVVAETTIPSTGVGYEVGYAVANNKKVVCLYHDNGTNKPSAMVSGNDKVTMIVYTNLDEGIERLKSYFT